MNDVLQKEPKQNKTKNPTGNQGNLLTNNNNMLLTKCKINSNNWPNDHRQCLDGQATKFIKIIKTQKC